MICVKERLIVLSILSTKHMPVPVNVDFRFKLSQVFFFFLFLFNEHSIFPFYFLFKK